MTELCDLSARDLRRMIGAREISPVELLESCLSRIEAVNPRLNAVTATCIPRARAEAKAAEKAVLAGEALGALHGLPFGVKDLDETEGLRTTWGSPIYADFVPAADNSMVARLRKAGAIVVGKTNVPEFGAGSNTTNPVWGATGNPFDPSRICGGSSGGSAVALATSMLPLCTGSDTGGSLRIPAAYCGITGYRPSVGLVPSEKRLTPWAPITTQGPMARDVGDVAMMLAAQAAYDPIDPMSYPVDPASFASPLPADLGSLRVAVSDDLGIMALDPAIRAAFRDRVGRLQGSFRRCDWAHPEMKDAHEAFAILRATGFLATSLDHYRNRRDKLGPNIVDNVEEGLAMSLADAARGQAMAAQIYRAFQAFFRDYDVLLTPVVSVPPFPLAQRYADVIDGEKQRTYYSWLAPTYALSITGHPTMSLPTGLEATGTPFALQLCGPAHGDRRLLEIALALEAHLARDPATARPIPDLGKLRA